MSRVRSAGASRRRKKRVLKKAKGQFGHRSKRYVQAVRSVIKGMAYEFRDRKVRKRDFRRLWIVRISAACEQEGLTYSRFIKGLNDANVEINRKVISDLAVTAPKAFKGLVKLAKEGQSEKKAAKKEEKSAAAKK